MLQINGQDVLFSTSVLLGPGETTTFDSAQVPGVKFQLQAIKKDGPFGSAEEEFKNEFIGNTVSLSFPFMENGQNLSYEIGPLASREDGKLKARIAGHSCGNFMVVYLHCFLDRT